MKLTFGGGINEINDIAISKEEAIEGQNFELGLGNTKFRPRAPFDLLDTTPNAGLIHGIHQLLKRDDTKTTLVASGAIMYSWTGSVFNNEGAIDADSEFFHIHWKLDQTILIVDRIKENAVLEWDGTTLSNLTHGIVGVTNLYAKYGVVANGRMMLANITTDGTENPHMLLVSAFEDRELYDTTKRSGDGTFTTGNEAFYILTPDFRAINGLIFFKRSVIISTENGQLFELVGDDSTNYRWERFYSGSAAVGNNSFVNAGNDVYYIRQGGAIESLRSTATYGDVGTDDISLQVRDTMKNNLGANIVYDQTNRKIFFFLGGSVIVLFKDLIGTRISPFSIYKTTHGSGYPLLSGAAYMELPASTAKTVMFGDGTGNIYDMNGVNLEGDGGTHAIVTTRKMPLLDFDYSSVLSGRVFYRKIKQVDLNITFEWGDEASSTAVIIPLKAREGTSVVNYFSDSKYFNNTEYFNEFDADGIPASQGFSAIGKGSTVFITMSVTSDNMFEVDFINADEKIIKNEQPVQTAV